MQRIAGQFLPSWVRLTWSTGVMATRLTALNKRACQWRVSVCVKVALKICAMNVVSSIQCECCDGSLRDLSEYCCDSLMSISQRHETDCLDITVFSEYGEENASISEFPVHEHQIDHELDCRSVSLACEEDVVSKKHLFCM